MADSSLLVYNVFDGARSVKVPGVPAVYASPPVEKRKKRSPQVELVGDNLEESNIEEVSENDESATPYGALAIIAGKAYGALALRSTGALYSPGILSGAAALGRAGAYGRVVPPQDKEHTLIYTLPTGCLTSQGVAVPCQLKFEE